MAMEGSGLSVADALALERNNDGMFGGNGMWVFFLFFLLAWGGNGGLLGGNGISNGANFVNNDFLYTNLKNTMDNGFMQTANQNFTIQKDLCNGFAGVQAGIAENRFAAQQCCCETNRNIDAVRYENARNTCDIVNAIREDGALTRAQLTQSEIQSLRDQLQTANFQLSQQAQSASIIDAVRPFPTPAYITCSPYTAVNGYGYGYNCGCGCGC